MAELGAAIIGCRAVANLHASAITNAAGVNLVAVCDIDREPAEKLAEEYNAQVETDFERVIHRDDVDVVHIVTPDELHAPMAIAAAKAGKHSLVEKPIALNIIELDEIVKAASDNDVRIMCGQSMRFRRKYRKILDVVRSGSIGRPIFARMSNPSSPFWRPDTWQAAGYDELRGEDWLLIHNGMHQLDYLCLLFDSFPTEVYTVSHPGQSWLRTHEYIALNILFENGAVALSEENRIMQPTGYPYHSDCYIVGTGGTIDAADRTTFSISSYTKDGFNLPGVNISAEEAADAFTMETQELVDAIYEHRDPVIPLSFTYRVLESIDAARRGFRSGTNVSVAGH